MTDSFTARLIEVRLTSAVREMATSMIQTSGSPAITEAKDFSTALFDAQGTMIAFGGYAAFHMGAAIEGVRLVRAAFPDTSIRAGDGFLVNDPYTSGALHVGDIGIVWPIFHAGVIVAWAYTNAHQTDIGGVSPGGLAAGAAECFAEGLMFPPTRVVRGGQLLDEWRQFIANNVRTPVNVIGDLQSLMAANLTAERRVCEVIGEFGRPTFEAANAANQSSAEEVVRRRLSSLPRATVSMDEWIDYERGGEFGMHRLAIKLTIDGNSAIVDVSESGEQTNAPINTCRPAVIGSIYTAFAQKIASDLPLNAGTFRPLRIEIGEPGSIVNPRKPAPNSIGHVSTGARLTRGLSSLLTRLLQASDLPELRAQVSGTASDGLVRGAWVGRDRAGNSFAFLGQDQTPALGARAAGDGLDVGGLQFGLGIEITDLEISESLYPVVYLWRRLSQNSGGAGTFRGGLGIDLAWTPHGADAMVGTLFCTASRFPGRGELGGLPGSTGFMVRAAGVAKASLGDGMRRMWSGADSAEWAYLPSYGAGVRVLQGDVVRVWSPGGGGIGDPAGRRTEWIIAETTAGRLTPLHVEKAYGVVLDSVGRLDTAHTKRRQVASGALILPLQRKGEDARHCGHCSGALGRWSEPLEAYGRSANEDLVAALFALGMRIKDDLPGRILRTLNCPHCGGVLDRTIDWRPDATFVATGRDHYSRVAGNIAAAPRRIGAEAAE